MKATTTRTAVLLMALGCNIAVAQHALDGLLDTKRGAAPKQEGRVEASVMSGANAGDPALKKKLHDVDETLSRNADFDRTYAEGKRCQANCYTISRGPSNSFSVKCLVGIRSGNTETVWHYPGERSYRSTGARHDSLNEAARFVCSQ